MQSVTAKIRAAVRAGHHDKAHRHIRQLLEEVTGGPIARVTINRDRYSLNSLNGFAETGAGRRLFFKFHQEEGEEAGVSEYYNARVLADAGYPVMLPLYRETRPGRQVLVYERIDDPRFSDVCAALEKGDERLDPAEVVDAQTDADRRFAAIALSTLKRVEDRRARTQPIFQLFYNRLVDDPKNPSARQLGGRVKAFYLDGRVNWPGLSAPFRQIWELPWRINGVDYPASLRQCFERCLGRLSPEVLLPGPAVTAHGDAHNANVWYRRRAAEGGERLILFDPAFAGARIPALLAEVKATFHNIFAHPFWLYEPEEAERRYRAGAKIRNGRIEAETDFGPSPLRRAFLFSKADNFWRPLLGELDRRGWLDERWEETVRSALFACPTLVMNLLAGDDSGHNPTSSLIGFCQAVRAAQAPAGAERDMFVQFLDRARPPERDRTGRGR